MTYELAGRTIVMPLSHDLPLILDAHRYYAANLVRLVRLISEREPDGLVVDVGANVGDSAVMIRQTSHCPLMCIEGDRDYSRLLHHNTAGLEGLQVVEAFVSFEGSHGVTLSVERASGSGHLTQIDDGGAGVATTALSDLLQETRPGVSPRLVKLDTDGYDSRIIVANEVLIATSRPVLFFEFDPRLMRRFGDCDYTRVFALLSRLGYERVLVYQNTGELLGVAEASDDAYWSDLAYCLLLGPDGRYVDVAAYHRADAELADDSVRSERMFFAREMSLPDQ
ncbi:MAG: FkbM family methyltransferase [Actinomycetes bacterium]